MPATAPAHVSIQQHAIANRHYLGLFFTSFSDTSFT
jgi:hypothetical protein